VLNLRTAAKFNLFYNRNDIIYVCEICICMRITYTFQKVLRIE